MLGVAPPPDLAPRYNIAPTQPVLALRVHDGARRLDLMRWGLVPAWSEGPDARYAMHNARLESITSKPAYRGPVRRRRCLLPADGWYEWQRRGTRKQPWRIARADGAPLCFAGLWDGWQRDAGTLLSCTILTAPASEAIAHIHPRMPLIAPARSWEAWLDPQLTDAARALAALTGAPAPALAAVPVSTRVNDARHDDAGCWQPLEGAGGPGPVAGSPPGPTAADQ